METAASRAILDLAGGNKVLHLLNAKLNLAYQCLKIN